MLSTTVSKFNSLVGEAGQCGHCSPVCEKSEQSPACTGVSILRKMSIIFQ